MGLGYTTKPAAHPRWAVGLRCTIRRCEKQDSMFALRERMLFDVRVTRSNPCVHRALRDTRITFLSQEIHSLSFGCPGKIILQIPAMPLGLLQKNRT